MEEEKTVNLNNILKRSGKDRKKKDRVGDGRGYRVERWLFFNRKYF